MKLILAEAKKSRYEEAQVEEYDTDMDYYESNPIPFPIDLDLHELERRDFEVLFRNKGEEEEKDAFEEKCYVCPAFDWADDDEANDIPR